MRIGGLGESSRVSGSDERAGAQGTSAAEMVNTEAGANRERPLVLVWTGWFVAPPGPPGKGIQKVGLRLKRG